MATSSIDIQRAAIAKAIRDAGRGKWKVLVLDQTSFRLVTNVLSEDDILGEHITNIERIEQRRQTIPDIDAIYILTPEPHIVECVVADLERRRYRQISLLWTSLLPPALKQRIDSCKLARELILEFKVLSLDYYPMESHVVTFRDPWSFPVLYHPQCNNLVRQHMSDLSQRIVSVCTSLGEYPTIRYFSSPTATHESKVLCFYLAGAVQGEIDKYATYHSDFPPPSARPRAALYILDRSMDLAAPLVHEFTYQAMVHDLLPLKEGDRTTYKVSMNDGGSGQVEKELEINEADKIWTTNRHKHMKDTIDTLMGQFQKFLDDHPHFANQNSNVTSLNTIKDMLAGLPQFQAMKEAYSLHLNMAQSSMNIFERRKLPDLASVEQILATGLDEEYKKPKNLADQVIRTLDEDSIVAQDRLRLILLYIIYRDGLLPADTIKLLSHAQLTASDGEVAQNLALLGQRISRTLKDPRPTPPPLFPRKQAPSNLQEDYSLSRFQPALHSLLVEHCRNTLDQEVFPYTKPQLDVEEVMGEAAGGSLRGAKPTWAKSRGTTANEPRQRVIVFMAGGATYSESRACYEVSRDLNKEVFLLTSHMITPSLFIRQVGDLSMNKRQLGIPAEQPKPKAPAHLFEPEPEAPRTAAAPTQKTQAAPVDQMAGLKLQPEKQDPKQLNGQRQFAPAAANSSQQKEEKKKRFPFLPKK